MKSQRWIVLSAGRVSQIEKLARLRETTIAGTVESLVSDRVVAGEIPAGFDAFAVERRGLDVLIVLDGIPLAPIPTDDAAKLAQDFAVLAEKATGAVAFQLADGVELTVKRNGPRGFTIAASEARFQISRSMLVEISMQLAETSR